MSGGESKGSCGVLVALIVAVVIIAVLLGVMLIPCKAKKQKAAAPAPGAAAMKKRGSGVAPGVRLSPRARFGAAAAANPRAVQHHAPQASAPAPLPAAQLMAPNSIPPPSTHLGMMQTSSHDDDSDVSASVNQYADANYAMDPGMMTVSSPTDIKGIETFMPNMEGGVETKNGPVDPSTGLPLFTTNKLVRSQLLSGHGAGSFLRQEQDPLSGYKRLGKNMCGAQIARADLERRRAQFNAQRIKDPSDDVVIFNTSEFMY